MHFYSHSKTYVFFSGVREAFHPNAVLELSTVGVGEVKILGLESNLFLAMNAEGQLYGEEVSISQTNFIAKLPES
jgi:hypothetical protein